jgi:CBS domain containing-hemolysin-like protein
MLFSTVNLFTWLLLAGIIILDLLFAVTRAAMLNVRAASLDNIDDLDPRLENRVHTTLERPRLRATLRLALGLTHFIIAALAAWIAVNALGMSATVGALIGILAACMVVLLALEFLLERFPLREPEKWAVVLSGFAAFLDFLFTPVTALMVWLQGSANLGDRSIHNMTEDELKTWVETEQPEGGLEKGERRMIQSIFEFGDTLCREIMVPRIDVLALEVTTTLHQATNALVKSGHSRVPVFEGSIDNIIGLLYAKDLLKVSKAQEAALDLRKLLRKAYFVPESKKVDQLLAEMQARGVHMAIVVDEYGGMAGLVTLEDIVEEIVGEIRDEYDDAEDQPIQQMSPDEFLFKGQIDLDDVSELLGIELTAEYSDSLGGYIYGELGRVPIAGDTLQVGNWSFIVEDVRGHRIGKIRARRTDPVVLEEEKQHGS